jgi:hypothetical protein
MKRVSDKLTVALSPFTLTPEKVPFARDSVNNLERIISYQQDEMNILKNQLASIELRSLTQKFVKPRMNNFNDIIRPVPQRPIQTRNNQYEGRSIKEYELENKVLQMRIEKLQSIADYWETNFKLKDEQYRNAIEKIKSKEKSLKRLLLQYQFPESMIPLAQ